MASEETNRRIEKAYQDEFGAKKMAAEYGVTGLSGALGMAAQYPGYEAVQKESSRQQAEQQYAGGPCCAHLLVGYVQQKTAGGYRGWWQCTECDMKFVPSGTVKA